MKRVCLAATFTHQPLKEPLSYWVKRLGEPVQFEFAPYGQVLEVLLNPDSTDSYTVYVLLVRAVDWLRDLPLEIARSSEVQDLYHWVTRRVDDLIEALKIAKTYGRRTQLLYTCLPFQQDNLEPEVATLLHRAEADLLGRARSIGTYAFQMSDFDHIYQATQVLDKYVDELAHIPFAQEYIVALGTVIARHLAAVWFPPYKVVVLDCDDTLYSGVCAEDGPLGIHITEAHQALQLFMLKQREQGMLLCLCSKNIEADVLPVFTEHPGMQLKLEHFTARRINWQPKSVNLRSLAEELGVGLDSFVFVDNDPSECAWIRANCPEVFVLELPQDPTLLPTALDHCWAFDRVAVTAEDRLRVQSYEANRRRDELQRQLPTFKEFLASLAISVTIARLRPDQVVRAAQLTERTNQFNFTLVRQSQQDIAQLLLTEGVDCWAVEAADRFGDYGFIGLMITERTERILKVETFLLSCRALNKGVEYSMLGKIAELGSQYGCDSVQFKLKPTARNLPAQMFFHHLKGELLENSVEFPFLTVSVHDLHRLASNPTSLQKLGPTASQVSELELDDTDERSVRRGF